MIWYLLVIPAYLLGSISSAIVISRVMGMADPRSVGSGNPGATNMLRVGGKKLAAITLLGDIAKGLVAVVLAKFITTDPAIIGAVAVAAFLGHCYPVYFGFKGGKGVAVALGVFIGLNAWLALVLMVTWIIMFLITRYSSLSALVAAAAAPVYIYWLDSQLAYLISGTVIVVLMFWRHRDNIRRLIKGEEIKSTF